MPLQETSGAASYDAFGGGVPYTPIYIEEVFSTWLYTGNGTSQTITNGIDVSGKGGLVWIKNRSNPGTLVHSLFDTNRGVLNQLISSSTSGQASLADSLTAFNANGFSLGLEGTVNSNTSPFVSWTFRKQPKFFDVVTYTGDGVQNRAVPHNLGSVPGCIIIKQLNSTSDWFVWHRSMNPAWTGGTTAGVITGGNNTGHIKLNTTDGFNNSPGTFTYQTSTAFGVYCTNIELNGNGNTYVAYVFAHNAGGFGLTGTDNVVSCGSFTVNSNGEATVNLGYEPQWLLYKRSTGVSDWLLVDSMRGMTASGNVTWLEPNTADAEFNQNGEVRITATGFNTPPGFGSANSSYIYIAIRRGPMKTPTTGTSVFDPSTWVGGSGRTTGFPVDSLWVNFLPGYSGNTEVYARLIKFSSTTSQVNGGFLSTSSTAAENNASSGTLNWRNTAYGQPQGLSNIYYAFQRAPGFMDVVCWTGNNVAGRQLSHNLGMAPEFMITKARDGVYNWVCWHSSFGNTDVVYLNTSDSKQNVPPSSSVINTDGTSYVAPTASVFTVGSSAFINNSSFNYVAYLFATCPGVSKVGSYTGTGALQTINCGFTGGARFVLIKRTDSTGDWYVYDSARGISSGNDPYFFFNSTAAQVTGTNYVDTTSVGFQVTAAAPAGLNANGGTYIFLAIA